MKSIFIILLITLLITLSGFFCKKINTDQIRKTPVTDFFIFGVDGGLLPGNYTYFKVQGEKTFRSKTSASAQETILFNTDPIANEKHLLSKKIKEDFPNYLLKHPNQTFGCPNCADQGAIHIEIGHNKTLKSWDIDTDVNQQPPEIRAYIKELLNVISQL